MQESKIPRSLRRISLSKFLLLSVLVGVAIGLFWPRHGPELDGCITGEDGTIVWVEVPTDEMVLEKFRLQYPDVTLPENAPIIKEKVFEEITPGFWLNFSGRRELHWVRFTCRVFFTEDSNVSLPVIFEYDHYHLNGSGCQWRD